MTSIDQQIIAQLPVVVLFMIFFFKVTKGHQDTMKLRDAEFKESILVISRSIDTLGNKVYALGLGFVALVSDKDPQKGAKAAQAMMEKTVTEQFKAQAPGGVYGD